LPRVITVRQSAATENLGEKLVSTLCEMSLSLDNIELFMKVKP